ncbi:DUF2569 family protein [Lysobacter capsici]|uniref:DUF2569 family protein n=1 Tax=Lysobacter capsici TaxID=435897 RepID=UPI001C00329C|nr:DUF2569 family protein [Lysobacter capsici]QWF17163.1 DUF2569 domain-containing protein [Lysobacter capsici]
MSTEEDPYRRVLAQPARGPLQLGDEPLQFSTNREERNRAPRNLGGWLRLVTLMMLVSPFNLIGGVFMTLDTVGQLAAESTVIQPTARLAVMMHVAGSGLLLLVNLVALVLLFLKSRWFPRVFIGWLLADLTLIIATVLLLGRAGDAPAALEYHFDSFLWRALMFDSLWIVYALLSKRVKSTFVP